MVVLVRVELKPGAPDETGTAMAASLGDVASVVPAQGGRP